MPSLLIRDLDDALHARLADAAARHRRSLEEEARELLRTAVARQENEASGETLVELAQRLFGPEHGVDLDIPPREAAQDRPPLDFSGPEWDHLDESAGEPAAAADHLRRGPARSY